MSPQSSTVLQYWSSRTHLPLRQRNSEIWQQRVAVRTASRARQPLHILSTQQTTFSKQPYTLTTIKRKYSDRTKTGFRVFVRNICFQSLLNPKKWGFDNTCICRTSKPLILIFTKLTLNMYFLLNLTNLH